MQIGQASHEREKLIKYIMIININRTHTCLLSSYYMTDIVTRPFRTFKYRTSNQQTTVWRILNNLPNITQLISRKEGIQNQIGLF